MHLFTFIVYQVFEFVLNSSFCKLTEFQETLEWIMNYYNIEQHMIKLWEWDFYLALFLLINPHRAPPIDQSWRFQWLFPIKALNKNIIA